jgi:hypothetical protein
LITSPTAAFWGFDGFSKPANTRSPRAIRAKMARNLQTKGIN